MFNSHLATIDWLFLAFLIMALLMSLHQAWENFFNKRISRYSVDRLILYLSDNFASTENRSRTKQLSKDSKRLFLLGVYAFLTFVESIHQIYKWITKNF